MNIKRRLAIKGKVYFKKISLFLFNLYTYILFMLNSLKNIPIKQGINRVRRTIKIKIVKSKFYFRSFFQRISFHKSSLGWTIRKFVNIKNFTLINLMGHKQLWEFIVKVLVYGLIIFGITGSIWGYSISIYIASVSGYWLYETVMLDDLPQTIIKINNSTDNKK